MINAIIEFIGAHLLDAIRILCVLLVIGCALIVFWLYVKWLDEKQAPEAANEYESEHTPMAEMADSFSADILIPPALKKQVELLRRTPGEAP